MLYSWLLMLYPIDHQSQLASFPLMLRYFRLRNLTISLGSCFLLDKFLIFHWQKSVLLLRQRSLLVESPCSWLTIQNYTEVSVCYLKLSLLVSIWFSSPYDPLQHLLYHIIIAINSGGTGALMVLIALNWVCVTFLSSVHSFSGNFYEI